MNDQEIFNKVYSGLRGQGFERSVGQPSCGPVVCLYRAPDGKKCAAGHLLPDEEYKPSMESGNIITFGWFGKNFSPDQMWVICDLQRIHDENETPLGLQESLERFGRNNGWDIPK